MSKKGTKRETSSSLCRIRIEKAMTNESGFDRPIVIHKSIKIGIGDGRKSRPLPHHRTCGGTSGGSVKSNEKLGNT